MAVSVTEAVHRLVLWDIDGTLIRAGEVGAAVFDEALACAVGRRPPGRVRMSGKTDPQIVTESLVLMDEPVTPELHRRVLEELVAGLASAAEDGRLAASGSVCPGVEAVLEAVAATPGVVSGLLTGNLRANAAVKVGSFGLDRWLDPEIGAFGSDHADRDCLVPIALERLAARTGDRLDPSQVWVVGDTPRDLQCAKAGGARCLLVATGRYGLDELGCLGADEVVADLSETGRIVALLSL